MILFKNIVFALAGNRTPVSRGAGENSTTEPPTKLWTLPSHLFYVLSRLISPLCKCFNLQNVKMLNTKSFQWFLLLIRPTCSLINQWMTSSRGCGCCVDCIRWLSCPIADVFKKNFERREKNSHAGNRIRPWRWKRQILTTRPHGICKSQICETLVRYCRW